MAVTIEPSPEPGGAKPGGEADLVRDLQQRVSLLEAQAQAAAPVGASRQGISARSVLMVVGLLLATVLAVGLVFVAWGAITLVLIALLFALALSPAVDFFVARGLGRGLAAGLVFLLALLVVGLLGLLLVPPLVTQVTHFIDALPHTVAELSKGRGPLGLLERKFHVVEQFDKLVGGKQVAGVAGSGAGVVLGLAGSVVGSVVIAFLTFFMLLEGPAWVERFMTLIPETARPRCKRVGDGITRTVWGFVTGNLLASLLGGSVTAALLLAAGLPYPIPIGVLVAALDMVPILGALVALAVVAAVSFSHGVGTGIAVTAATFVYHQFEVYYLRPIIYGRMIELSPLAVLVAAVIGTELAGPLGAIAAIPIAGTVQIVLVELLDAREASASARRRREIVSRA
jgi:predicted PurR-regulated permease PerM